MLKAASEFVPILIDGDVDKGFGKQWNASGYPHVIFASAKGKELGRVLGYVPAPQFLSQIQGALKKNGRVRLTKAARALEKADADLSAVVAIEKIGHEGAALARAREARAAAENEAARRLALARELIEEGKLDEAKKLLRTFRSELAALKEPGKQAKALLGEIAAAEKDG